MAAAKLAGIRTIVLASRKGGAGKTTLAAHLAVEAERQKCGPVVVIDTDPMGSLSGWWNARKADAPANAQIGKGGLQATLRQLEARGFRLAVIDTQPAADQTIRSIVAAADLVLIPVIPSPHDLRAIGETIQLVEGQGRGLAFIINNTSTRARLTLQAFAVLRDVGPVAITPAGDPIIIGTRQDFRSSMTDGRTVMEIRPDGGSAQEIADLWRYVHSRVGRGGDHGTAAIAA